MYLHILYYKRIYFKRIIKFGDLKNIRTLLIYLYLRKEKKSLLY